MRELTWYTDPQIQALYLHIPFCLKKCFYCDFASWEHTKNDPLLKSYVQTLLRESKELQEIGLLDTCKSVYIGGGTPSLLGEDLIMLLEELGALLPELQELTAEANPESLSTSMISSLAKSSCSRLSIGVQTTNDRELSALGRLAKSEPTREIVQKAVRAGLDVSCDLMCAIPYQSDASFIKSINDVVSAGAAHISIYPLQIEENTPLAQTCAPFCGYNSEDIQANRMKIAEKLLQESGFLRYEVASYARPHKACIHNIAYWTGKTYWGLGSSAAGMLTPQAYTRLRKLCVQLPALSEDVFRVRIKSLASRFEVAHVKGLASEAYELEFLTEKQAVAEDLMLAARLTSGISADLIGYATDLFGRDKLYACLDGLVKKLLLTEKGGSFVPTERAWLLGNELFAELWGLAPEQKTEIVEVKV